MLALASLPLASHGGDRVTGTMGILTIEGAGGGGLTPWALIAGAESSDQVGGAIGATRVRTHGGYQLTVESATVGIADRVEVSLSHANFGLSDTVPGQHLAMQTVGLKVRVLGDAVYDQDRIWPQVSVGLEHKHTLNPLVPNLLGARRLEDLEPYVAATKIWLAGPLGRTLLVDLTLRGTRADQFGLLGFGGPLGDTRRIEPEGSVALLVRDDVAVGLEGRRKPNLLAAFREQAAYDAFVAWFPLPALSLTAAAVNLGNIANKPGQRGWFLEAAVQL